MVDPITIGTVVTVAVASSGLAYGIGKERSDSEGCNGHHWGEPYRPDDEGVSSIERERAGLDRCDPKAHLEAEVFRERVCLRGKAIKKCQDCGKRKAVDITIGRVPIETFEEDDE